MKIALIVLCLLVSLPVTAPEYKCLIVPAAKRIDPYKPLKFAIGKIECFRNGSFDTLAINHFEQAYGYFQVRQVRLDDYWQRTGIRYSLEDMLDYTKAERVFMYYASEIGFRDPGKIARNWNGSGPATWDYWKKVRTFLN